MKESKISIITASYNYAEYIEQTIESVIYQTYKNWEYIIIDDGSTDNSVELIKNYTKNYDNIHLYEHADSQNKGLKQTLLLGLEKATGEYIAFLESDDFWELNYLEEKVKLLNIRPQPKLIYNLVNFVGDKQVIQEKNYTNTTEDACKEEFTYKNVAIDMLNNPIIPSFSSVFVEKNALENCDFNTPLDAFLDWWIWTQIACKYKILHINKKLTNFRAHSNSYTDIAFNDSNTKKRKHFLIERYKLFLKEINTESLDLFTVTKLYFYVILKMLSLNTRISKMFRGLLKKTDLKLKKTLIEHF